MKIYLIILLSLVYCPVGKTSECLRIQSFLEIDSSKINQVESHKLIEIEAAPFNTKLASKDHFIMKEIKQKIEKEIVDLHKIFVHWFTGALDRKALAPKLASRFFEETIFISPQGASLSYEDLMMMFENGYGRMNSNFKIVISDVELLQEIGDYYLVNYKEWQTKDPNPQLNGNYTVRKTTVLMSKQQPFKWLHIHETMMPNPSEIVEDWRF